MRVGQREQGAGTGLAWGSQGRLQGWTLARDSGAGGRPRARNSAQNSASCILTAPRPGPYMWSLRTR